MGSLDTFDYKRIYKYEWTSVGSDEMSYSQMLELAKGFKERGLTVFTQARVGKAFNAFVVEKLDEDQILSLRGLGYTVMDITTKIRDMFYTEELKLE